MQALVHHWFCQGPLSTLAKPPCLGALTGRQRTFLPSPTTFQLGYWERRPGSSFCRGEQCPQLTLSPILCHMHVDTTSPATSAIVPCSASTQDLDLLAHAKKPPQPSRHIHQLWRAACRAEVARPCSSPWPGSCHPVLAQDDTALMRPALDKSLLAVLQPHIPRCSQTSHSPGTGDGSAESLAPCHLKSCLHQNIVLHGAEADAQRALGWMAPTCAPGPSPKPPSLTARSWELCLQSHCSSGSLLRNS